MGRRVVLVSSFTLDRVEVGGNTVVGIGGPAYYAGLTLKALGLDPVVITSAPKDLIDMVEGLSSWDLEILNLERGCDSPYIFHHTYRGSVRISRLYREGCRIDLEGAGPYVEDAEWIIASPVYREIDPADLAKALGEGSRLAIDLQGFARSLRREVLETGFSILRERAPALGILRKDLVHFSSDDVPDLGERSDADVLRTVSSYIGDYCALIYTRGSKGSTALFREATACGNVAPALARIPPHIEGEGDPTGCGDVFLGSLVAYIARGLGVLDALVRASIVSGMRVRRGFPLRIDLSEVEALASRIEKIVEPP